MKLCRPSTRVSFDSVANRPTDGSSRSSTPSRPMLANHETLNAAQAASLASVITFTNGDDYRRLCETNLKELAHAVLDAAFLFVRNQDTVDIAARSRACLVKATRLLVTAEPLVYQDPRAGLLEVLVRGELLSQAEVDAFGPGAASQSPTRTLISCTLHSNSRYTIIITRPTRLLNDMSGCCAAIEDKMKNLSTSRGEESIDRAGGRRLRCRTGG